jgi:hypothetical protein
MCAANVMSCMPLDMAACNGMALAAMDIDTRLPPTLRNICHQCHVLGGVGYDEIIALGGMELDYRIRRHGMALGGIGYWC